jgi:hypothetical protein
VPRTQRSAISAFTRVFDALWLLRSGALQSRGRNKHNSLVMPGLVPGMTVLRLVRSRFCEETLHRARDTKEKRPLVKSQAAKSREETPKEGSDSARRYRTATI